MFEMNEIKYCKKRDGVIVSFEKNRITSAINKAFLDSGEGNRFQAQKVTETVVERILRSFQYDMPSVEDIQDIVEDTLMGFNYRKTAKKYILYRDNRQRKRITS